MLSNTISVEYNLFVVEYDVILYFIKRLTELYDFLKYPTFIEIVIAEIGAKHSKSLGTTWYFISPIIK